MYAACAWDGKHCIGILLVAMSEPHECRERGPVSPPKTLRNGEY